MRLLRELANLISTTSNNKSGGHNLIDPSSSDKGAKEMGLPSFYHVKDVGSKTKMRKEKMTVKSSGKDKKVYGRRTLVQKNT